MLARRTLPVLIALTTLLAAAPAHALDVTALRTKLTKETGKLGRASGAEVVDLDAGTVLFARRPDLQLVPASNEKLFTTATALLTYGGDATLDTTVVTGADTTGTTGTVGDATAVDALYLVGAGDPTLSDTGLARLATQVVASGITRVRGGVVGDEALLDARRGSVDSAFKPDLDLGGQLGALVVSHGAVDKLGPAHLAAARLQAVLKKRGVAFGKQASVGAAPADSGDPLATLSSPPISELVRLTSQPSDNFYAELLLKDVGAEAGGAGTTAAGAGVVRATMTKLGVRTTANDGSGLSRTDRTAPRQIVTLLTAMRAGEEATGWLGSLPVAGRSGTLIHRMRGTAAAGRCMAKTGTLRGVSALSGYCTTTAGRHVAFSFIENGVGTGAKAVEDRMVAAVAKYGS